MSADNKCLLTKVCPLLSALTCFWRKCNLSWMEKVQRERLRFLPTLPQIQLQTQRSLEATCSPLSQFSRSVELFREFDTLHRTLHHVPFTGGVRGHGHAWFTNREPVLKPGHGQTTFYTVYLWRTKTEMAWPYDELCYLCLF